MSDSTSGSNATVASWLIGIQAAMAALIALALFSLNANRRGRFAERFFHQQIARHFGLWGALSLAAAALLVMLAFGVAKRRSWAAMTAYVAEGVLAVGSLLRFHPLRSLVGFAVAVAVIVLIARDHAPGAQAASSDG
jgi:hypothetical protein